MYLISDVFFLS